jgi:hypothetical protein
VTPRDRNQLTDTSSATGASSAGGAGQQQESMTQAPLGVTHPPSTTASSTPSATASDASSAGAPNTHALNRSRTRPATASLRTSTSLHALLHSVDCGCGCGRLMMEVTRQLALEGAYADRLTRQLARVTKGTPNGKLQELAHPERESNDHVDGRELGSQ